MRSRPKKHWLTAAAILVLMVVVFGIVRLQRTAEYIVRFGDVRARADLCRAVPYLNPRRQRAVLLRLLHDDITAVRSAAVTACSRIPPQPELEIVIGAILTGNSEPAELRVKAGRMLLDRTPVDPQIDKYLSDLFRDAGTRVLLPDLYVRDAEFRLPASTSAAKGVLIERCFTEVPAVGGPLRELVRDHIESFSDFREQLANRLRTNSGFAEREFILACLSGIPVQPKGTASEVVLRPDTFPDNTAYEAEWAQGILANYQIQTFKGVRCLALDEGAGGILSWLKGRNGTVDVGSARFSLMVAETGTYRLWARLYFDDKCGNSFGIWLDKSTFQNFPDRSNTMQEWHWLPLKRKGRSTVHLKRGRHAVRIKAYEDSVYIDKFALLPQGHDPNLSPPKPGFAWDETLPSSLSFSMETQSQPRATVQTCTVWVRRNTPDLTEGVVVLTLPPVFRAAGPLSVAVRFPEGSPVVRADFSIYLPPDAVAGEDWLHAVYTDKNGNTVRGRFIIGAQYDWMSTGPLRPSDAVHKMLSNRRTVTDRELDTSFRSFPVKGYDRYRRLNLETAYGQMQNQYAYLSTDFTVAKDGIYTFLLTVDDTARIYVDGELVQAQNQTGPGEGRMKTTRVPLKAGRHRMFVPVYQGRITDPVGPRRARHTYNHCAFKLLIRKSRHEPAPGVKGVPR